MDRLHAHRKDYEWTKFANHVSSKRSFHPLSLVLVIVFIVPRIVTVLKPYRDL